jgi:DNA-directed RNA polymerase subunit M/transcription elongation factor TFIIS
MAPHVIPWYQAEDRATRDALDVQACKACGAVLWRRETTKDKPKYPPAALVGDDCPGTEDSSMAKKEGGATRSRKPRPEQADLPGTEDSAIAPLENAAKKFKRIKEERKELNVEEAKLRSSLVALMHKYGKTSYRRHGVEIDLIPESENVKVKIADEDAAAGEE